MKTKKRVLWGMLAMGLAFGLVLAACGSLNPFSLMFGGGASSNAGTGSAETAGTTAGTTEGTTEGTTTSEFETLRNNDGNLVIVAYTGSSKAVVIPAEIEGVPVVEIGEEVFSGNTTMKSVTIPEGVTGIGKDAFDGCTGLTSIAIPASVVRIGKNVPNAEGAFDHCSELTGITVAEANGVYSSEGGVLFNKDKTTLLFCPEGKSGSYTIPSSVTEIAECAFEGCEKLTGITIPDSVMSIGNAAFLACSGLASVTIPDSVTSIGNAAFLACSGLASVTIPDSVTSIGELAFADCSSLPSITIPASVKTITGNIRDGGVYGAFNGCLSLTSVTISEGVTSIGATAFFGCVNLTSITIPNSVTYIGANAFADCRSLTSVTVSPVNGRKWDDLDGNYSVFADCSKLSPAAKDALKRAGYTGGF